MAPELLYYVDDSIDTDVYSNAVDMWCLGSIVYEILTMKKPFPKTRLLKTYCAHKADYPTEPLTVKGISNEGIDFIKKLMDPMPTERLTVFTALHAAWLARDHTSQGPEDGVLKESLPKRSKAEQERFDKEKLEKEIFKIVRRVRELQGKDSATNRLNPKSYEIKKENEVYNASLTGFPSKQLIKMEATDGESAYRVWKPDFPRLGQGTLEDAFQLRPLPVSLVLGSSAVHERYPSRFIPGTTYTSRALLPFDLCEHERAVCCRLRETSKCCACRDDRAYQSSYIMFLAQTGDISQVTGQLGYCRECRSS